MATDKERKIHELKEKIREFCEARDWDQFHNAKELAIALSIEASELLEIFRWKTPEEVQELFKNEKKKEDIKDEMADILYFLVRMAQRYNIDLSEALDKKMEKNEGKYPIDKAKGSSKKYNEF
jgi:NTP pyrophosphatase (non-canonical NTP hydrolase)